MCACAHACVRECDCGGWGCREERGGRVGGGQVVRKPHEGMKQAKIHIARENAWHPVKCEFQGNNGSLGHTPAK